MGLNRAERAALADRRAKLVEYRRQRRPYAEFYAELGYASQQHASRDFNRLLEERLAEVRTSLEAYREEEIQELDHLAATAIEVMRTPHYEISASGRVAEDPTTGLPLLDDKPKLAAIDRLLKIQDRRAKLLGLDSAQRVEVLTLDALTAEAERLNTLLAANDAEAVAGGADPRGAGRAGPA
jgi:hypothetical protein